MASEDAILVLNSGSSSLKFALFSADARLVRLWTGAVERIGREVGHFRTAAAESVTVIDERGNIAVRISAIALPLDVIDRCPSSPGPPTDSAAKSSTYQPSAFSKDAEAAALWRSS